MTSPLREDETIASAEATSSKAVFSAALSEELNKLMSATSSALLASESVAVWQTSMPLIYDLPYKAYRTTLISQTFTSAELNAPFMFIHAVESGPEDLKAVSSWTEDRLDMLGGGAVVRVAVSSLATTLKASFDPVSTEQDYKIRSLNETFMKGYEIPKLSTR